MATSLFWQLFPKKKPIIAMVHVFDGERQRQIDQALEDVERLQRGGVDGLLVENYDCGYLDENLATEDMMEILTAITEAVFTSTTRNTTIPIGLNVLPNDYEKAFRICWETGARFVQLDHVTGEFVGCRSVEPQHLLAARSRYPGVVLFGGVHPKYYELVEPTCSLAGCAKRAIALADAVVVTGQVTGDPATLDDLRIAREAIGTHPLVIGSGLTPKNAQAQLTIADGAIVGTAFKRGGVRSGESIDVGLVKQLMDEVARLR